jgi:beta-galactosidase
MDGSSHPELRFDGFVNGHKVLTRQFSSDPVHDEFVASVDDSEIHGDSIDATRVVFQINDKYGAPRFLGGGDVSIELTGPGELIGDQTFSLTESGGVGAVWIRSMRNASGVITVKLTHATLGSRTVRVTANRKD